MSKLARVKDLAEFAVAPEHEIWLDEERRYKTIGELLNRLGLHEGEMESIFNCPTCCEWADFVGDIYRNGLQEPIKIRITTQADCFIVDGHHRFVAVQQLGWKIVPVEVEIVEC